MGIEGIKTGNIAAMPQFKANSKDANVTTPETKKNGNGLLYGALAGLAVIGATSCYIMSRGKGKNFIQKLGYKFENKVLLDKEGKKFTGELVHKKANTTYTFKDGILTKSVTTPKKGNVSEIVKNYDEATGKIINNTKKMKDGNYTETVTTFTREEGKTIVKKEGTKADGAKETFETLTTQKNGDKVQITKQTLDKDGKMIQESKEFDIKKKGPEPTKAEAPKPETPKAEAPKAEAPKAEAPKAEAPTAEAPKAETPKAEAPKTEAPKAETPKAENPADKTEK